MERLAFVVRGRVQGVWFRASTREIAERCGVSGWIRNRQDGAVEGEVQGTQEALGRFREFLADGPAHARVDEVDVTACDVVPGETSFVVR